MRAPFPVNNGKTLMIRDSLESIYVDIYPILSDTKVTLGEYILHFSHTLSVSP